VPKIVKICLNLLKLFTVDCRFFSRCGVVVESFVVVAHRA